jgi:hypothetical protein
LVQQLPLPPIIAEQQSLVPWSHASIPLHINSNFLGVGFT